MNNQDSHCPRRTDGEQVTLVDLLTDAYMADLGIAPERLEEIRTYRDRIFRLVALLRRRSAPQIASLLDAASVHAKGFERIVGDAIEHLGFSVTRLGEPGQPEGVATAVVTRGENDSQVAYRFTYDAKSSTKGKSKTHNVGIAGLVRHRNDHKADHILVVAPDFEQGALEKECTQHGVTPMRARDLARLVMLTAGCGPISLVDFREVFTLRSPTAVATWIDGLVDRYEHREHLPLNTIIEALEQLYRDNPERPDTLDCSLIAEKCRIILGNPKYPSWSDVARAIQGLALMAPSVISIAKRDVFLTTAPGKIAEAMTRQLQLVPDHLRYGLAREDGSVPP
jgi:hypothetical protein